MGNDNNMNHPGAWAHIKPGDDLSGHLHNPFFVRARDGRYYDVAPELGMDDNHVSRGIAIADVDGDGDLDYAVADQWETSYFFRNDVQHPGASLELVPRLPATSGGLGRTRPAVGAEVTVTLPDGRRRVAQVDGGSGHSGKRAPEVHFGLGSLSPSTVLRVDVRWRDGQGRPRATTLRLAPGRHTVVLGEAAAPPPLVAGENIVKPAESKGKAD
jgi:hypothetical protein